MKKSTIIAQFDRLSEIRTEEINICYRLLKTAILEDNTRVATSLKVFATHALEIWETYIPLVNNVIKGVEE